MSGGPPGGVVVIAEDPTMATRAPSDVLRLVIAVLVLLVVTLLGVFFGDGIVAFTSDLLRGLDQIPSWLMSTIAVLAQVACVVLIVLAITVAARARSPRLFVATVVAALAAAGLAAALTSIIDAEGRQVADLTTVGLAGESNSGTAAGLAALTALIATVGPWTSRRWRRIGWAGIVCAAVTFFSVSPVGFNTVVAVLAGWTVGTAALVIAGAPSHRPTGASIAAGLASVGVPLARLEQVSLDARGSTPYFGETVDGQKLFVKALGDDERSADLLFRAYRRLQPRDLGDERAFSSLRRAVEHEAMVAMAASQFGVRTPRLVAFAPAAPQGYALAYEAIAGRSLDRIDPDELTDALLDGVWGQLALLRGHRTAHRDLRLANVFLADDGEPWIIDFGFSELAASATLLATDLAELIASSSTVVGPDRAVAAAVRAVGEADAATALGRLRLPFLSGATTTALKADPATLEAVRNTLLGLGAITR